MAYIFGKGLIIRGEVAGEGDVQLQGELDGKISLTGTVVVEEGARVHADVSATEIIVAGFVRGNIVASDRVELSPTGHLVGDISTKALIVREGAALNGSINVEPASRSVEMTQLIHAK
jgi:cytoskeletal protein CcmA (bactofilin family)